MTNTGSRIPYVIALVAVIAVVLAAWVNRDRIRPVMAGFEAPDFTLPDLDGAPVRLQEHRDKVVLVNVWATWCAPCREEMPSMERLYQQFRDDGLEILAVSIDAQEGQRDANGLPGGNVRAFADSLGLTFPILRDPSGRIQQTYQTTGVPESFLIGKDGVIYKKVAGSTMWDSNTNVELVGRLLEGE